MTPGQKSIALAVSITLNVVLIAAVIGGLYFARQAWRERAERGHLFQTARELPDADQTQLRDRMREAGREARPQFRLAREHRRKAAELAAAPTYDRAGVLKELSQGNAAEMRGRAILDEKLTTAFGEMNAESRRKLAPSLEFRSRGMRGRRGHDRRGPDGPPPGEGPPPEDGPPPA